MRSVGAIVVALLIASSCSQDREPPSAPLPLPDGHLSVSGDEKAWVLLVHQHGKDYASWDGVRGALDFQGYSSFAFDFDEEDSLERQVRGAIAYLREERSPRYLHLVGASKGCTASLLAAAVARVDSVTCLSGVLKFGDMELEESDLAAVQEPTLFIVDPADEAAKDVREIAAWANDPSELNEFEGVGHGTDMFEERQTFDDIFQLIVGFMERADGAYDARRLK